MAEDSKENKDRETRSGRKLLGLALQVVSAVGLLISTAGVISLPVFYSRGARAAESTLNTLAGEIRQGSELLEDLGRDLENSQQALDAALDLFTEIQNLLADSQPLLEDTAVLLSDTAPGLIADTGAALGAAEEGARAVDRVLRSLARISFITGVEYDPEQSLDAGIAAAVEGLEPLPGALQEVGRDLEQAGTSLAELNPDLETFSRELDSFTSEISDQQDRLERVSKQLRDNSDHLEDFRNRVKPGAVILGILSELALTGMIVILLALYTYGQQLKIEGGNQS